MASTKREQLKCHCGGNLQPHKIPYKEIQLDGYLCDRCDEKGFSFGQVFEALRIKESYNRRNDAIPWHSGKKIKCTCSHFMMPEKVYYRGKVFDGYRCFKCKQEIFNIAELREDMTPDEKEMGKDGIFAFAD